MRTVALESARSFPIVGITGPRQSGKTTLAQQCFADKTYINLEDPSERAQVSLDPKSVLHSLGQAGAIFDEVHHVPELLSYLQVRLINGKLMGSLSLLAVITLPYLNRSLSH